MGGGERGRTASRAAPLDAHSYVGQVPASVIFEGVPFARTFALALATPPVRVRMPRSARRRKVLLQLDEPVRRALKPQLAIAPLGMRRVCTKPRARAPRDRLQLLNTTVQSLALHVNRVLTACYHAIFDDANDADELTLLTAPLSSTAEVQQLFTAGLIDSESALPAALHSLGCSASEIEGALERRRKAEKAGQDTELMQAQTAAALGDADVALKSAQTAKTEQEVAHVEASTEKVRAEAEKTAADIGVVSETNTVAEGATKKAASGSKAPDEGAGGGGARAKSAKKK